MKLHIVKSPDEAVVFSGKIKYASWHSLTKILSESLGCTLSTEPNPGASWNYFIPYLKWEKFGTKTISLFTHIEENDPKKKDRYYRALSGCDKAVFITRCYYDQAVKEGFEKKSVWIPIGIDMGRFRPIIKFGICSQWSRSGRKENNLAKILKSFDGNKNIIFEIVGEGWDRFLLDNNLSNLPICYRDWISDGELVKFYNSIDCLLIPSKWDGGPLSCVEALACGKPVISYRTGLGLEFPSVKIVDTPEEFIEAVASFQFNALLDRFTFRKESEGRSIENWVKLHKEMFNEII